MDLFDRLITIFLQKAVVVILAALAVLMALGALAYQIAFMPEWHSAESFLRVWPCYAIAALSFAWSAVFWWRG